MKVIIKNMLLIFAVFLSPYFVVIFTKWIFNIFQPVDGIFAGLVGSFALVLSCCVSAILLIEQPFKEKGKGR